MTQITKKNIEYTFLLLIVFLFFNITNYYLNHTPYYELAEYYQFYDDYCNTTLSYNTSTFYCDCYKVVYDIYRYNFATFVLSFMVTFIMSCTLCTTINHIKNNLPIRITCTTLYLVLTVFFLLPLFVYGLAILNNLVKEDAHNTNLCTDGIKNNFHEEFIGFKVNLFQIIILLLIMLVDCVSCMCSNCFMFKVKENKQDKQEKEPLFETPPPYTTEPKNTRN
jgi:hypothetical protein